MEREISSSESALFPNAIFDSSGNFILYPTLIGIKVVNLITNRVVRILGKQNLGDKKGSSWI